MSTLVIDGIRQAPTDAAAPVSSSRCPCCRQYAGLSLLYGPLDGRALIAVQRSEALHGGKQAHPLLPDRGCSSCGHQWHTHKRARGELCRNLLASVENGPVGTPGKAKMRTAVQLFDLGKNSYCVEVGEWRDEGASRVGSYALAVPGEVMLQRERLRQATVPALSSISIAPTGNDWTRIKICDGNTKLIVSFVASAPHGYAAVAAFGQWLLSFAVRISVPRNTEPRLKTTTRQRIIAQQLKQAQPARPSGPAPMASPWGDFLNLDRGQSTKTRGTARRLAGTP